MKNFFLIFTHNIKKIKREFCTQIISKLFQQKDRTIPGSLFGYLTFRFNDWSKSLKASPGLKNEDIKLKIRR